jgi:uncharacterized membrane protein YjjB (DUF3815 family)
MIALGFTFFATVSYGIIFQVPIKTLLGGGLIGIVGWMVETQIDFFGFHPASGKLAAAFSVAILSQILSSFQKVPATVFSIAGIIPLVPGFLAYTSMTHLMNKDFLLGLESGMETALSAGAIAAGLMLGESMVRLAKGRKRPHVG